MRTHSQSRNKFPQQEASPAIVEPFRIELPFLEDQFQEDPPEDPPEAVVAKVSTSSSTQSISSKVAELKDMVRALLLDKKNQSSALAHSSTPAPVKAVEPNYVTCGGTHSYQNCPAINENVYRDNIQEYVSQAAATNYNQRNTSFRPQMVANQIRPPGFPSHQNNQNNFNRGLVQNKQFFGHNKEDPHAHIRHFNKITSTMRVPNVPNSTIKLMFFPFSLKGVARIWLEKEPPRSILTWDDLVSKFINQFFPPSKTTNLRNEITRFQQRFDESFSEAWDRFNDLLRACPHHGFSELHQLDTFYNALNNKSKVRQSRAKAVVAKVNSSSSTPAISSDVAELKDMVRALLLDKKN
nr:reverse transcriptase domain-containing protein [Tanacetum cinerariifolium]